MMILFDGPCPAGWSEEASFRGRMIRGDDGDGSPGETGGTATHSHDAGHDHGGSTGSTSHTHTGSASASSSNSGANSGSGVYVARVEHVHTASSVSSEDQHDHTIATESPSASYADHTPPFREVVVCRMD
jgi:hypothetical protein